MRAVVQRVSRASVAVEGRTVGKIGPGLLVLLGVAAEDSEAEADWMADKLLGLRIFANEAGKFDRSVADIGGEMLVVSQFTLYADTRKGRRPSFTGAAPPAHAIPLYERVLERLGRGVPVQRGVFGAHMDVELVNDGPVTVIVDTLPTA
jgi:D-tyrosyl-tRNA(Tyr) deacylase